MAEIIVFRSDIKFDPSEEAKLLAVNEACAYRTEPVECDVVNGLCMECKLLAHAIEQAMIRAFLAGQASMTEAQQFDEIREGVLCEEVE